jgi:dTDP-glucose 4,6-dehydratase
MAAALLFLLRSKWSRDKVNIVGEREVDNLSLAQMIAEIVGKPLAYEMVDFHSSRPGHDLRYALDGSKLRDLGWEFPRTFEESLEKTVRWMLDRPDWLGL